LEGRGRGLIEAYSGTFLEGKENHKASTRITGVSAQIRPKHLKNTTLELYKSIRGDEKVIVNKCT
jgi:hypothetical protein